MGRFAPAAMDAASGSPAGLPRTERPLGVDGAGVYETTPTESPVGVDARAEGSGRRSALGLRQARDRVSQRAGGQREADLGELADRLDGGADQLRDRGGRGLAFRRAPGVRDPARLGRLAEAPGGRRRALTRRRLARRRLARRRYAACGGLGRGLAAARGGGALVAAAVGAGARQRAQQVGGAVLVHLGSIIARDPIGSVDR